MVLRTTHALRPFSAAAFGNRPGEAEFFMTTNIRRLFIEKAPPLSTLEYPLSTPSYPTTNIRRLLSEKAPNGIRAHACDRVGDLRAAHAHAGSAELDTWPAVHARIGGGMPA